MMEEQETDSPEVPEDKPDSAPEPAEAGRNPFAAADKEPVERPPAQPPAGAQTTIALPHQPPRFTYVFLAVNILAFLATMALGNVVVGGRSVPLVFFWGQKDNAAIVAGEYWRLVTPIFLHINLVHVGFNSYALYMLGPQVEARFGYARFVVIYVASGIAGVIASLAFTKAPSIGASGAIFGLIGALIVHYYANRKLLPGGRVYMLSWLRLAGINLLIGLRPGIDNWGHIGGMLGGAALTWVIGPLFAVEHSYGDGPRLTDRQPFEERLWVIPAVVAALVLLTMVAIQIAQLPPLLPPGFVRELFR